MPDFTDFTALALLALVFYLGERWARRLTDGILRHLERMTEAIDDCKEDIRSIKESFDDFTKD